MLVHLVLSTQLSCMASEDCLISLLVLPERRLLSSQMLWGYDIRFYRRVRDP